MKFLVWLRGLVGNNLRATILIGVFLLLLVFFAARCSAAVEADLSGGASFGCLKYAPVMGLDIRAPFAPGFGWNAGVALWGNDGTTRNNFDWHGRVEFSRGAFGAGLGVAYLQNIDQVNGSHGEFSLELFWRPWRVGAELIHISDAGTTATNCGRNAGMLSVRLR